MEQARDQARKPSGGERDNKDADVSEETQDASAIASMPLQAVQEASFTMVSLGAENVNALTGMLQSAGGNSAVQIELDSLTQRTSTATQKKADKDAFASKTDSQKVAEIYGGGREHVEGTPESRTEGHAPESLAQHADASSYLLQRATQLQEGGNRLLESATELSAAASDGVLEESTQLAIATMAECYMREAETLQSLANSYVAAASEITGNEFGGIALPDADVPAHYMERISQLNEQKAIFQSAIQRQREDAAALQENLVEPETDDAEELREYEEKAKAVELKVQNHESVAQRLEADMARIDGLLQAYQLVTDMQPPSKG